MAFSAVICAAAFADAGTETVTLAAPQLTFPKAADGTVSVLAEGYAAHRDPGNPVLPSRCVTVLLPPEADLRTVRVTAVETRTSQVPGQFAVAPAGPLYPASAGPAAPYWGEGKQIVAGRNALVYGRNALYPAAAFKPLPPTQKRIWKCARVLFFPCRYNPATRSLQRVDSLTLKVAWNDAPSDKRLKLADDPLSARFFPDAANALKMPAWYAPPDRAEGLADPGAIRGFLENFGDGGPECLPLTPRYVIITTNEIEASSSMLADFVSHKESLGYRVLVVTEDDYGPLTGQAPNGTAEKIRQWLVDHWAKMRIEYVLLIGDPDPDDPDSSTDTVGGVPMKMCWPLFTASDDRDAPTDYFYADATGNWDPDGDGYFGEWNDYTAAGGVDLGAEFYVGRIPVYDDDTDGISALDRILEKIVRYETSVYTEWRRSALLPMSFYSSSYDAAVLGSMMRDDYLDAAGYESYAFYQQGSGVCGFDSAYDSEAELLADTAVRDRWAANRYGIVCWAGHGGVTIVDVGDNEACCDGVFFTSSYAANLNDNYPSFVYQASCWNAKPEDSSNLSYSLLENGAIAAVGATRTSYYGGSPDDSESATIGSIGYGYNERIVAETPCGRALYGYKEATVLVSSGAFSNLLQFNIYGDPSVSIAASDFETGWSVQDSGVVGDLYDVAFADRLTGWAVGDDGILHTSDGGAAWELQWDGVTTLRSCGSGERLMASAVDPDGYVIVTGYMDNGTDRDVLLAKYDAAGTLQWSTAYDGGDNEYGYSVEADSAGEIVVRGGAAGRSFLKYDSNGSFLWKVDTDFDEGINDMAVGPDGSIYLQEWNSEGVVLWKYDADGNLEGSVAETDVYTEGGAIAADADGNVLMAFRMESGPDGLAVRKYDRDLAPLWEADFSPEESSSDVTVAADPGGNVIVCNGYEILKLDPDGNELWTRGAGETGVSDWISAMAVLPGGDIAAAGTAGGRTLLGRIASGDGELMWHAAYGCLDGVNGVEAVSDYRLSVTGLLDGSYLAASIVTEGVTGVSFIDANRGWAVGPGKILRTDNGGATWEQQDSGGEPRKVQFLDASTGYVLLPDGLIGTEDGGDTWTDLIAGSPQELTALSFCDADHGWVCGLGGAVLYTADGGATWSEGSAGSGIDLYAVAAISEETAHAAGSDGHLVYIVDGDFPASYRAADGDVRGIALHGEDEAWCCGYSAYRNVPGEIALVEVSLADLGIEPSCTGGPSCAYLPGLALEDVFSPGRDIGFNAVAVPASSCAWIVGDDGAIWHYE